MKNQLAYGARRSKGEEHGVYHTRALFFRLSSIFQLDLAAGTPVMLPLVFFSGEVARRQTRGKKPK